MIVETCFVELWHLTTEQDKLQACLVGMVIGRRYDGAWDGSGYLLFENKIEN